MKALITHITLGLVLLGTMATAPAQSVLTITGTGSGTLNGSEFSDAAYSWELTFSTGNPNINFGTDNPIYTLSSSVITLQGVETPINVTQEEGLWFQIAPATFMMAPIRMSGSTAGGNILTIYGSPGWDTVSAFTSDPDPGSGYSQFSDIATDQGSLTMWFGNVSLVTITGITPVPEPSTMALAALGGTSLLLFRRRK